MRMAKRPQRNWASVGRCVVVIALGGLAVSPVVGCGGGSGNGAGRGGSQSGSGGSVGGQSGSGGTTNTGGASGGGAFGGAGSSGGGGVTGTGGSSGAGGTSASGGAGSGGAGAGGTAASGGRAGSGAAAGGGSGGASGNGGQAGSAGSSGAGGARLMQNFNQSWKFKRADVSGAEATAFDDSSWENVGLPHSFSLPYFMASKFYVGYGWYRKHFSVPSSWTGKNVSLEFQAAFDQAEIYVNGTEGRRAHRRLQRVFDRHHLRHQDRGQRRRRSTEQQVERENPAADGRSHLPGRALSKRVCRRHGSAARRLVRHLGHDADAGDELGFVQHRGDQDGGAEQPLGRRQRHIEDGHRRQRRQGGGHHLLAATDRRRQDRDVRPNHARHQQPLAMAPRPSHHVPGAVLPFRRHGNRRRIRDALRVSLVQLVGIAGLFPERRAHLDPRREPSPGSRRAGATA